ncbi:uncharacterized protein [Choristoneura fumiferana]|uniref:uncharacterized protein n=1 Tax=Choristoneura fumiferana TaxID=7141 RepID=UPI003D156DEC
MTINECRQYYCVLRIRYDTAPVPALPHQEDEAIDPPPPGTTRGAAWLSGDSAVMALRRMIARRGCPTELWSDNGTNFRAADKELRNELNEATREEAAARGIRWRFIPPGSPFMGGAWERLVSSVKKSLQAVLHERHPSKETLATLLAEAEYTVNSRPLTHVAVEPDEPEAITPNHLLLGGSARVPTPGTFDDSVLVGRATWRTSQRLADH